MPVSLTTIGDDGAKRRIEALVAIHDSREDRDRRKEVRQRLRVYGGDARHLVRRMPAEDKRSYAAKPKLTPPLLSHSLRQISFLYDIPPRRMVGDKDEWEKRFWSYGGAGWNASAHEALPKAKLCGDVLAWYRSVDSPTSDEDAMLALMGVDVPKGAEPGISTDLWTPDDAIVKPYPSHQRIAEGMLLYAGDTPRRSLVKGFPTGHVVEIWHYIDPVYYARLWHTKGTKGWEVEPQIDPADGTEKHLVPHGLGMMPVQRLPWKIDKTQKSYWTPPWAGRDLIDNLSDVYSQFSEYMWTAKLQRGQPVGRDVKGMPLGPAHMVELGDSERAMFTIVANNANLVGMKESLTTALSLLAKTLGLPSRTFRLEDTAALSGIAIVLDRGELEDQRRGDEQTWRLNEAQAHRKVSRILSVRQGLNLDKNVTTTFSPLAPILTQEQKMAQALFERSQGSMSLKEMKAWLHEDLPEHVIDELLVAAAAEATTGADVQRDAMNGAQTGSLQGFLESTSAGLLPAGSTAPALESAFPTIPPETVRRMTQAAADHATARAQAAQQTGPTNEQ